MAHRSPWLALALGLVLTAASTRYAFRLAWERGREHFDAAADTTADALRRRMDEYGAMLRGTRGLLVASAEVNHAEFSAYVSALSLVRHYPGIQGIGYARRVRPGEVAAHEAHIRSLGLPGYHVWPPPDGRDAFPVTFLEPDGARNARPIGYDLASESVRREAIERVLHGGGLEATAPLPDTPGIDHDPQANLLLLLGLRYPGTPASDDDILGLIYGAFRVTDLVTGVLGSPKDRAIDLALYDGPRVDPRQLFYADPGRRFAPARYERIIPMEVGGRTWTVRLRSRKGRASPEPLTAAWITAALGLGVSVLLFAISRAQVQARVAAEAHAAATRAALEARDVFLGIASHELRTPVTTLRLQLERLARISRSDDATPLSDPGVRGTLEMLLRQERRLGALVEDLLDHLRITTGGLHLAFASVDLADVTRDVVDRRADDAQRVGSVVTVDAQEPIVGRWDRLRVDQIVTNLVGNALKEGAGRPVHIQVTREGLTARLEVRDQGIGIAPGDVSRIFGRFERAAPSQGYGGFGLGLYIVREVVEVLGGTVTVQSTPGEGSVFSVTLPIDPPLRQNS